MTTLLQMCKDATEIVGIDDPSSIINNPDETARRLLGICKASGRFLLDNYDWQVLNKEQVHTATAAEDQGAISSIITDGDYNRFRGETFYNRSQTTQLNGSMNAEDYSFTKGRVSQNVWKRFRIRGNNLLIVPAPAAGESIAMEYISSHWVLDTDGTTTKATFDADTDTVMFDTDLFVSSIIWRLRSALRLDFSAELAEFNLILESKKGADVPRTSISLGQSSSNDPTIGIPEGNWNVTS